MRKQFVGWLVLVGALVLAPGAQAHVSFHPNTLPAGSFPTIEIRVPNEEKTANTTKVTVQFPPGFIDVVPGYVPGWTVQKKTRKLATPVKTDAGTVSEEISEVIWSGKLPPEYFGRFPFSTTMPDAPGKTLTFKTLQTYDNGKVVRWIGPPSASEPAPFVNVTAKGGVLEDVAGTEAGPGSPTASTQPVSSTTSKSSSSDSASKGLGITALIIGILGLIAGVVALVMSRRSRGGASGA